MAPDGLYDLHQACIGLFGTINDFTLLYNKKIWSKELERIEKLAWK
ncbi:hypothetical protein [Bacillus thuringiensis]|nr:hypothetical protein [Bacillus thuringiensis]